MNPAVDAVLFDLGGVLAGSPFEAFARYEESQGLPAGFLRQLNATNHEGNAWARLERNEIDFDTFCQAFEAEAADGGASIDARELFAMFAGEIRPQMLEAVRRCHRHFKTGLLTNTFVTPSTEVATAVTNGEMAGLFDVVVASYDVGMRKPDPRFYELACRELDIRPERAVFLDDLGVNLKPARAMGMVTIKVEEPAVALAELEAVLGIALR